MKLLLEACLIGLCLKCTINERSEHLIKYIPFTFSFSLGKNKCLNLSSALLASQNAKIAPNVT